MQWRSAIGTYNNFIKTKETCAFNKMLKQITDLYDYFGPMLFLMFFNMSYSLYVMSILLLRSGNVESNPGPEGSPIKFCHLKLGAYSQE